MRKDLRFRWLVLTSRIPTAMSMKSPPSWMVQEEWLRILEESLKSPGNWTWTAFMHLGVMLYEKGEEEKAIEAWENSIKIKPSPWVYRNLAVVMKQKKENEPDKTWNAYESLPACYADSERIRLLMEVAIEKYPLPRNLDFVMRSA